MNYEAVILVIHLIVAVSLIVLILVQPSEAGGFMGSGSMSNMMAPRRSADVLTRTTTILAGCFFATSMLLAIAANHHPQNKSILDVDAGTKTGQGAAMTPATAPAADLTNTTTNTMTDTNTVTNTMSADAPAPKGKKGKNAAVKSDIPKAPQTK